MTTPSRAAVALSRRDDRVLVVQPGDDSPRTLAERGRWPAWHPNGDSVAVSVVDHSDSGPTSRIVVVDAKSGETRLLYASQPGVPPVIAPRIPHYLSWSPDGKVASYVAMTAAGIALSHQEWPPGEPAREVAGGAPLFSAWSPDSRYQAVHAGASLLVVDRHAPESPRVVTDVAVGFRAPAYSDDGATLAYAARSGDKLDVRLSSPGGDDARTVATFSSGVILGFQPGTGVLTVATASSPTSGVFDALWLIAEREDPHRIYRGPFAAYAWRPDGQMLALVVPTQTGDGRYAVYGLVPAEGVVAATEGIVPSDDYRALLGFFDQYLQSHRLWAPDGSAFLVVGRLPTDAVSASFGDSEGPYAWTWAAERGAALETVTAGTAAFFAPRAPEPPEA